MINRIISRLLSISFSLGLLGCASLTQKNTADVSAPTNSSIKPTDASKVPVTPSKTIGTGTSSTAANPITPNTPNPSGTAKTPPKPIEPTTFKPFNDLVVDLTLQDGLLPLWYKRGKVLMELRASDMKRPFFMAISIKRGLGEKGWWSGLMHRQIVLELRRVGDNIHWIALNPMYYAAPLSAQSEALNLAYPESLIAVTPILSFPHPERKSVLVDLSGVWANDLPYGVTELERLYKQAFVFDVRNSFIEHPRVTSEQTSFDLNSHYVLPKINLLGSLPDTTADWRSVLVSWNFSLTALPKQPMHPRVSDPRVGHFVDTVWDYTTDVEPILRKHYVQRWRLEKKDPTAPLSEPVKPIVFWIDKNVPPKYRESVRKGILAWNVAFEKIGYQHAIVVKEQTAQDKIDTLDTHTASVRWMIGSDANLAIGPSMTDPRTGEILDADVLISESWVRGSRDEINLRISKSGKDHSLATQTATQKTADEQSQIATPLNKVDSLTEHSKNKFGGKNNLVAQCFYGEQAFQDMHLALQLLYARGIIEPDSPEAEQYVQEVIQSVVIHEVGHALGLRHNFIASQAYSLNQLKDEQFVNRYGLASSVMDYVPTHIALKGEKQGPLVMNQLGEYDFWAIEYAYAHLDRATEKESLKKIAERVNQPDKQRILAYASDEEVYSNLDPRIAPFDLGNSPLLSTKRRFMLSRELLDEVEKRVRAGQMTFIQARRMVNYALGMNMVAVDTLVNTIGGVSLSRNIDSRGSSAAAKPIAASEQKEVLQFFVREVFEADSMHLSPELLQRLAINPLDGMRGTTNNYSLMNNVLKTQRIILEHLFDSRVAIRMLDAQDKDPKAFRLYDAHEMVRRAIWSELSQKQDITQWRRNLQRDYTKRLLIGLVYTGVSNADERGVLREMAKNLVSDLNKVMNQSKHLSKEASLHLQETRQQLQDALNAKWQQRF